VTVIEVVGTSWQTPSKVRITFVCHASPWSSPRGSFASARELLFLRSRYWRARSGS